MPSDTVHNAVAFNARITDVGLITSALMNGQLLDKAGFIVADVTTGPNQTGCPVSCRVDGLTTVVMEYGMRLTYMAIRQ